MTSSKNKISCWDIAAKMPGFIKGMPKRYKALKMVSSQTPDTVGSLGVCLEDCAKQHPDALALVFDNSRWTYQQLNAWINRLAHYFLKSGLKRGDVVAVFIENRPELLVTIAALSKVGAVAALINTSQRSKVLRHSLDLVNPKRLIVGEELFFAINELSYSLEGMDADPIWVGDPWQGVDSTESTESYIPAGWKGFEDACSDGNNESDPASTGLAIASEAFCYFYTSGTTGLPKAAVMSNGRYIKAFAGVGLGSLQLGTEDRVLVSLPFYHGTALVVGWGSVLAGSAALVMVRQFSARQFWPIVRANGVTAFCYVGELCRYLLALPPSVQDKNHNLKVMFGNGLRPNIWREFKQRYGVEVVAEFYGSSEGNVGFLNVLNLDYTVGLTTVPYAIVEYDLDRDEPIRAKDGFMKRVVKGEAGLLLGEITDDSPYDGYTDDDKTQKTILRNVFAQGDAWFNTGDLMRDQGYRHAQFVDRLGDTFRWKGENVSTAEVENAFSIIPGVVDAVVYGVEISGTNGRAGMACIRLQDDEIFDPKLAYKELSDSLPKYAVPIFVRITKELSTTGTHKYQKSDLKKQGFDSSQFPDPLWILLPGEKEYMELSKERYAALIAGEYSF